MNGERIAASIRSTSLVMIAMLAALAVVAGYWQAVRGPTLAARDDNPRHVLAERQIPRGAILDRNGRPLAISQDSPDGFIRSYPERAAEPVVGYYSLRYGVGGVEAAFDDLLRGTAGQTRLDTFVNSLLHRIPPGQPVRLTLDMYVQQAADDALGDHVGAVVVLSTPEGEVIALASHPTFDPATLDKEWDQLRIAPSSPLLNRATQGSYQPGAAFQTVILAESLSRGWAHLTETVSAPDALVTVGDTTLGCAAPPAGDTLADAFAAGCPAPFARLANRFESSALESVIQRWKLNAAPVELGLPVHVDSLESGWMTGTQAIRDVVVGQGALTVSPLQMALVMGAIANDGRPTAPPHLTPSAAPGALPATIVSSAIAGAVRAALPVQGDLAGQTALAISGDSQLAWFSGLAPASAPQWAIVVLLEDGDTAAAQRVAAQVSAKLIAY
jgi:penicillin-binding protein A